MIRFNRKVVKFFSNNDEKNNAVDFLSAAGADIYEVAREIRRSSNHRAAGVALLGILKTAAEQAIDRQKALKGGDTSRKLLDNKYLEKTLKDLHYTKGYNFTVGEVNRKINMSMTRGTLIITSEKGKDSDIIDKYFYNSSRVSIGRSEIDKMITYTLSVNTRQQFEFLLKKLMSTKLTFNILN